MERAPLLLHSDERAEGAPQNLCKRDVVLHDMHREDGAEERVLHVHRQKMFLESCTLRTCLKQCMDVSPSTWWCAWMHARAAAVPCGELIPHAWLIPRMFVKLVPHAGGLFDAQSSMQCGARLRLCTEKRTLCVLLIFAAAETCVWSSECEILCGPFDYRFSMNGSFVVLRHPRWALHRRRS